VNKFIQLFVLLAIAAAPAVAETETPIRINCGGPNYTDSKGQVWQADKDYNDGAEVTIDAPIKGTLEGALFQNNRYNSNAHDPMVYTFSVANGPYHVNLYFAETNKPLQAVGARVFNVEMQGRVVFSHMDIFAEAGADAALIKGADISVTNGKIEIQFDNVVQDASIAAIEIVPGNSGPQLSLTFKYPDGTPVAGTLNYTISSSMLSFQGHEALVDGQATCALIGNPSAIGISMQFTLTVSLNDAGGHLLWGMKIGMNPSEVNLGAVQNSNLTVTVQKLGAENLKASE